MRDQKVVQGGASGDRSSSSAAAAPVARRAAESAAGFVSAPCRFMTRQQEFLPAVKRWALWRQ